MSAIDLYDETIGNLGGGDEIAAVQQLKLRTIEFWTNSPRR